MSDPKNMVGSINTEFGIQILNQSSDKIFVVDEDYILRYFNPSAQENAKLFGLKKLELGIKMLPSTDVNFWIDLLDKGLSGETLSFKKSYLVGEIKHTDFIQIYPLPNGDSSKKLTAVQAKNFEISQLTPSGLMESEPLFQSFFETSPVGITIRKFYSQELVAFNSRICELFGCTSEEFRSYNRSNFIHYEDNEEMKTQMKLLGGGKIKSFKIEKQYKNTKTGNIFWGVATRSIFKIGNEFYQMGILEDISTQKKFEDELVRNEAKLKGIFNSTRDKIFAINKDLKLIDVNNSALKILGHFNLGKIESIQLDDFDFSENKYWLPHFKKAFKGEEFTFERSYFFEDEHHTDLITVSPLKNNLDEIIGASVYGKEITEIKNIQIALAESEARLLEAERLAKLGYWEIDIEKQIITWSEGSPRIFGLPASTQNISLEDYYKLVYPDDVEKLKSSLNFSIKNGVSYEVKSRKFNQDGQLIYTVGRGEPLIVDGKVVKFYGTLQDVTKESLIEIALIESEAKLRAIFNSTNDKIYAVDRNFNLLDFNEAAAKSLPKILEIDKLELGIKMLGTAIPGKEMTIKNYNDALNGISNRIELSYFENGETKTDLVTISPIQNKTGGIIGVAVYGKEISALEKAKKEVRETQIKLEDAQKLGKIGTINYFTSNQNIVWSISALNLLDFQKEDTPPNLQECLSLIHPEDIAGMTEAVYATINKGIPLDYVARTFTKTGRLIYFRAKAKAIFENDKLISIEGTAQDITRLKEIEENIQNTTQLYRDLFNNVHDAVVITNQEGKMIDANSSAEKLLGYPREELSKLLIKDIVHPDDQERSKVYLERLIKDGYYSDYQGRIIAKDGSIRFIQVNSNAILDENGKMIGSRDIVRDISQLKKAEEKREQLLLELADVNKELKDFAYIVSHDLKAPLRAINNISHWLSEDYANILDEKGQKQLQLLSNRVNRMHEFINGIFEYTKMSRVKETKEVVDLNEVIRNATLMLNLKDDVDLKVIKKLPEIYCEKIKIEQVFQNLIGNAIKYNDKKICKIDIDFENLNHHFLFRVTDNGKGIEEKNFEKIFQIFQTLQSKDDFESTGIGLTIVKRIIQLHGGQISVKSELGKSTTFEFTIEK